MTEYPFHINISNLEELADIISETLHCPITIEDATHKLLSYSTHHGSTDAARTSTIIQRRVPERVINHLWKEGIIPSLLASCEPVYIHSINEIGLGNRLAVSIWHKDEVLGFIWALEMDKSFEKEDIQLLKQAAEAAKNLFMKRKMKNSKNEERHQEFLWKLLTSHYHSNERIVEKFHTLHLAPPSLYAIVIFQFSQEITDVIESKINYLLNTIQKSKVLLYTIDQQKLIFLSTLKENDHPLQTLHKFSDEFISKMKERYGIESIIQGFSGLRSDYTKVEKSYTEALTVLSMKKFFSSEVSHIHSYQNLGFYRYLDVLLENKKQHEYENYSLKKLNEYDKKYNNNLVETLDIYLNKDCNVHCAAKSLNIHPNTLSYRIKRISEIGEIDLKDVNQKMTLFLDLKLKKFS